MSILTVKLFLVPPLSVIYQVLNLIRLSNFCFILRVCIGLNLVSHRSMHVVEFDCLVKLKNTLSLA